MFFPGVDTRQPLWALIDLYGNCSGLELINVRIHMSNFQRSQREQQQQLHHHDDQIVISEKSHFREEQSFKDEKETVK